MSTAKAENFNAAEIGEALDSRTPSANDLYQNESDNPFSDVRYICNATSLIVGSLRKGLDVAHLPSGDIIITEVKTINTQYSWDKEKNKLVKVAQNIIP